MNEFMRRLKTTRGPGGLALFRLVGLFFLICIFFFSSFFLLQYYMKPQLSLSSSSTANGRAVSVTGSGNQNQEKRSKGFLVDFELSKQQQRQQQQQQQQHDDDEKGGEEDAKNKYNHQQEQEHHQCDLFQGNWVLDDDDRYPMYNSSNCAFLDQGFRCSQNGRPDTLYTKWRWQPDHCDLPRRLDAREMLERLRNRRLVFVGDSIARNQWESLLCMLSSAVLPDERTSSVYEVNGRRITRHDGFFVFKFGEYNCSVEYYRAPFLVVHGRPPRGAPANVSSTLRLDTMDWTCSRWKDADVLVFNSGHWWSYEKTIRGGCYFQEGGHVKLGMSIRSAYKRSIRTLVDWIHTQVNLSKTQVIYRTYSPTHFRGGGDGKSGGNCHLETLPEFDVHGDGESSEASWGPLVKASLEVLQKQPAKRNIQVMNITWMTEQRKDGHSSLYYLGPRNPAAFHRQDCSHWCLPGIPDTWNELLYTLFLRRRQWRN